MNQEISDDRLISYLLGELSEGEQIELESVFFADESSFEHLLLIEDELINDYLSNELSEEESERFRTYFLSTPERKERVEFNRELLASINKIKVLPNPRIAHAKTPQFIKSHIAKPALLVPAAVAMLLLLGSLWLYVDRTWLRTQMDEMQAKLALLNEEREALNQQIAEQQTRSQEISEQLRRNQDERKKLELELAKARQSQSVIASFMLAPSESRNSGAKASRIVLSSNPQLLRLKLRLKTGANYKYYRAALQKDGKEILTINELRSGSNASSKVIDLILPSSIFTEGDYLVTVFGITDSRSIEAAGNYSLKVVKK